MNDTFAAALLGVIQGLTEFLPVSSTAHLALTQYFFGLDPDRFGLTFDVALHMGTALAVLLYFFSTWVGLLRDLLARRWRMPGLVIAGTIPAAVVGVLLQSLVERELRGPLLMAAMLVVGSLIFIAAEAIARRTRTMESLGLADALVMGSAQAIALLPGISRSGITISAGLARGLERADATRFSFLLATPIILGAGAKTLLDLRKAESLFARPDLVAIGFVLSFATGLATVAFLMRFLRTHSLIWFVPYRLILATVVAIAVALGTP